MQPVQDNLGKQFQKSNGDCKIGLSCNNPRQQKGIEAACNAPGYSLTKRLVMAIVCHASWLFSLTCEMLMRLERLLSQAFSFSRLSLCGYALSFYGYLHKVLVSSATPSLSGSFASFTLPTFGSSTK
jgi:hypothetical protein